MPRVNLSRMTVEALMDLRKRVDETLVKRRAEIEQQLERITVVGGRRVVGRGGRSILKGLRWLLRIAEIMADCCIEATPWGQNRARRLGGRTLANFVKNSKVWA